MRSAKYYTMISRAAAEAREKHGQSLVECAAMDTLLLILAKDFCQDNPRFNPDRFMSACKETK